MDSLLKVLHAYHSEVTLLVPALEDACIMWFSLLSIILHFGT